MNDGCNGGCLLLRPETVALRHRPAIGGGGDFLMAGSGLDWPIFTEEPHEMWGKTMDLYGMQGHGGANYGYRASLFMLERDSGAYGVSCWPMWACSARSSTSPGS